MSAAAIFDPTGRTIRIRGVPFVVGVGFGLCPARKASRLDPIEALRFE